MNVTTGKFEQFGRLVVRHKLLMIVSWCVLTAVACVAFPSLEGVVRNQSASSLPADMLSMKAIDRMVDIFHENGVQTAVTIVMTDPAGLGEQQTRLYQNLVEKLHSHPEAVYKTDDLLSDPQTRERAISHDGRAWFLKASLKGTLATPGAQQSFETVKHLVHQIFDATTTSAYVTGPPATVGDVIEASQRDIWMISTATSVLLVILLIVVYRSVFTAMLPLIVIGTSCAVTRGTLAELGELGFPLSQISASFMTTVLLGAVTDYSIFLISRYHERIRAGDTPAAAAAYSASAVGRVIVASAATVIATCIVMSLGKLKLISTVGPASAVAIIIGLLAAMTLLPSLLVFASKLGIGMPKRELTSRYWAGVSVSIVRRPRVLLATSLTIIIALAGLTSVMKCSYDDRSTQLFRSESNVGYSVLDQHFSNNVTMPITVMIESHHDMRNAVALADLDQMAARINQLPGVDSVEGITRPNGNKLDLATLSAQNGIIGNKLSEAGRQIDGNTPQLDRLTDGADQIALGLARLKNAVEAVSPKALEIFSKIDQYKDLISQIERSADTAASNIDWEMITKDIDLLGVRFDEMTDHLKNLLDQVEPINGFLATHNSCETRPACDLMRNLLGSLIGLRDAGMVDQLAQLHDLLQKATGALTASDMMSKLRNDIVNARDSSGLSLASLNDLSRDFDRLRSGVAALADGASRLASGIKLLVVNNLAMGNQLAHVGDVLREMDRAANTPAMSGFYLPAAAFSQRDFVDGARFFVSANGTGVRYIVQTRIDPWTTKAIDLVREIERVANDSRPKTSLDDASIRVIGYPAVNAELRQINRADFLQLAIAGILIVAAILAAFLRSVAAPIYLVGSVVLSYLSALGLGVLVFQLFLKSPIYWAVPPLSFIVLVAVGADYNMLVISRLREESRAGIRVGVLRTVTRTGAVVTFAGIVFAVSMFGLMAGSLSTVVQTGFVIGSGLLLDTLIVRTLIVPAIAILLGKANWWPSRVT